MIEIENTYIRTLIKSTMKFYSFIYIFLVSFVSFAQQHTKVDFLTCNAMIQPDFNNKSISGSVKYEFIVKSAIDTIKIDAITMAFSNVAINDKVVSYKNTGKTLALFDGFIVGKNSIEFDYITKPKQALYFSGEGDDLQIWTQGQGKYTSHWLPSFDDVNEKVIFNIGVTLNSNLTVISNGKGKGTSSNLKSYEYKWFFEMDKPMSSYLVMLAIGNFEKQTVTTRSGTTLAFYLDKKDIDKFEPTYRYSKQMFEYLEKEIGINYPWHIYKQIPVRDFLYSGMENTTATIFDQDFVVDSIGFNDKNYLNVNAHELAHQWFGDLVTSKESKHHWLQEGFATYYSSLAQKAVLGDDFFNYDLLEMAVTLERAAKTDTIPILNEKASSLTFYKKGAWALHVLRSEIGAKKFQKAVKCYLEKYQYKNVDTDQFLAIVKKVSGYDVATFKKEWLETPGFELEKVKKYITNNQFVADFFTFQNLLQKTDDQEILYQNYKKILTSNAYFPLKQQVVYNYERLAEEHQLEIIQLALATKDLKVRQAVAQVVRDIPQELKPAFETLLNDASYLTREIALVRLWTNFKEDQARYMELSKEWVGLNNNLKIAHLTIEIVSSPLGSEIKNNAIASLEQLIYSPNDSTTRQASLETLISLQLVSDAVLLELVTASLHYKWQFVKFAKDNLRILLNDETMKARFIRLQENATNEQQVRMNYFLKEY